MVSKGKVMSAIVSAALLFSSLVMGCSNQKPATQANQPAQQTEAKEESKQKDKLAELMIQAPMGISIAAPIYKIVEENSLQDYTEKINFSPWKTPDELRARISSGQAQVSAVPTYVGANLYNRGMDVKLINTLIWGILYVVGPDGEKVSWESLKGKTIHVPFKGDMPDLVFQYLLKKNNVDPVKDVNIEYVSAPQELVQLLVAGKASYAVIPEHVATLSVLKGKKEGKNLAKVMNLQEEWAKATGKKPRIPQAGILVSGKLIEQHPELVEALQDRFKESVSFLNEKPDQAAGIIAKYQEGLEQKFIQNVIPSLNLQYVPANLAKEELEFFFNELSTLSPEIIGGKLPDEGFYYQK